MSRLESPITREIMELLARVVGGFSFKKHGSAFGIKGVPDIYLSSSFHADFYGRAIWVEVKRPGEERSASQILIGKQLEASGAIVLCVTSAKEVEDWLLNRGFVFRPKPAKIKRTLPKH